MGKKRHFFDIQLNSIIDTNDPSVKEVEFILHDFDVSHNNSFISKESAMKSLHTLKDKPIVCKYHSVSDSGANDDALSGHEAYLEDDRETGSQYVATDTTPIGVFTEPASIVTIQDENGNDKEVVIGKGVLWSSRFSNVVGLLKEWNDNDIPIVSSMEILYDSYKVENGLEEILNFVYEGHCILNSEDRGRHSKVAPAYDVSKITRLVAQVMNEESEEISKMSMFKKVFQLSHKEMSKQLQDAVKISDTEYGGSWISDVYEDHFIVNEYSWKEGDSYDKHYKYSYTKDGEVLTVDLESKVEVTPKTSWVDKTQYEKLESSFNEVTEAKVELESQLLEVKGVNETLTTEKSEIEGKFNESVEKLTQLNSLVEELKPFKEQLEQANYEKSLSENQEIYGAKFTALNAIEKFKEDEVQELVKQASYSTEEGQKAKVQLNSMLVEMIVGKEVVVTETPIHQQSSKREDLIPQTDSFESRYMV